MFFFLILLGYTMNNTSVSMQVRKPKIKDSMIPLYFRVYYLPMSMYGFNSFKESNSINSCVSLYFD